MNDDKPPMTTPGPNYESVATEPLLTTELLVLPDGRVLVHNLTPVFADLLSELNPDDEQLQPRAGQIAHPASHLAHPAP